MLRAAIIAFGALACAPLSQGAGESARTSDACGLERAEIEEQTNPALEACAERGDADAMMRLGFLYWTAAAAEICENVTLTAPLDLRATCRLDDPANFGFPSTMTRDELREEGRRWVEAAAARGNAEAQNELGLAYLVGDFGIPVDYEAARRWLQASTDGGDQIAPYNLARIYFGGLGVEASNTRGEALLRVAAERGMNAARCSLVAWLEQDADARRRREAQTFRRAIERDGEYCPSDSIIDEMPLVNLAETL